MSTVVQQSPYLRQQRNFPNDNIQALTVEIDKSYIDIATKMNSRIIGTIPVNSPVVTGEQWFITGQSQKQQTLRQLYTFTATTAINHGITNFQLISPRSYGSYTDGTSWFGLPFGTSVAVAGQIGFYVTSTQIVFTVGAGAPAISSGQIILEWLSQF